VERQVGEILDVHRGMSGAAARVRVLELLNQVGIREPEKPAQRLYRISCPAASASAS
jgi:ABC-type microcin C transport system duplicated ATPase subunit YejF